MERKTETETPTSNSPKDWFTKPDGTDGHAVDRSPVDESPPLPEVPAQSEEEMELDEAFEAALSQSPEAAEEDDSMFDPANCRIEQSKYDIGVSARIFTSIQCRKPKKTEWVRVTTDPAMSNRIAFFEDRESMNREVYMIAPNVTPSLDSKDYATGTVYLAINRQNIPFLWLVKKSGLDGEKNRWWDSMEICLNAAKKMWIRMYAEGGAYMYRKATASIPDPIWPEGNMKAFLKLAFRDYYIRDLEHPVIKNLRGD
jgi:hypothetical protein